MKEQLEAYRKLRDLSQEEISLLEEDPDQRLGPLLAEKRDLLDNLEGLDREEEPLRTAWKENRDKISPAESERIMKLSRSMAELLEENLNLQRKGEEAARDRSVRIQRELASLAHGKNANRGYYTEVDRRSRFIDRNG